MEQRKTLWIIAAVSIFLLVVLGFALIWSQTSTKTIQTSTSIIPVEKTNYSDGWTNNNNSTQSPAKTDETSSESSVTQVKDMFVVSENTTIFDLNQNEAGTTIDLNALKNQQLYEKEETVQTVTPVENNNVVVKNESPASTTVAATPVKESAAKAEQTEKAASVKQPATTVSSPAKTTTTTTKPATTSTATTTKTTTTTTTTSTAKPAATTTEKAVTRYWVQVASYTNKKTAENARTILADNKINSDIYTYQDSSNTLYYRVRVGPYTTKSEAEYWMTKIAQISEFSKAGSYVTVTNN